MSGHKRRMYPQQQISAYDVSSQLADEGNSGFRYGQPPPASDADNGGVFVPAAAAGIPNPNQLNDQMSQMNLGNPGYGYGGSPLAPIPTGSSATFSTQPASSVIYNGLTDVDLLRSPHPPVNELDNPPPALNTPLDQNIRSEYAQGSPEYIRCTLNTIPASKSLLNKSKLPLAVVFTPFGALKDEEEQVPLVSDMSITRCRRCRTYINPFVRFDSQGYRWECNVCYLSNDAPKSFDWDEVANQTSDRWSRAELNYGIVEYLATPEYINGAPRPPTYVFVIDVSVSAVSNGSVAVVSDVLRKAITGLPNSDGRTRVAFLAVDGALNYFQIPLADPLNPEGSPKSLDPKMLLVSDLEDPFLPVNNGLLVNVKDNMPQIDRLLELLPELFATSVKSSCALGSGIQAAEKLISNVGGKIVVITSTLPNAGIGKLEMREDAKLLHHKNEYTLLNPGNNFYKKFAVDCNRCQVSVDMFVLTNGYTDLASLSNLAKFTGGKSFFYPSWNANDPANVYKLDQELTKHLGQEFGMEGMYRTRGSSGIHPSLSTGHFFVRSTDLATFPMISRDNSFVMNLKLGETITKPFVVIQGALLYTSSHGERRIRVMTVQIPVSDRMQDIYASADQQAIATWHAHEACDKVFSSGYQSAFEWLDTRVAEIVKTYRADVLNANTGVANALSLPQNLSLLPLLLYAIKKSQAIRTTDQLLSDFRVNALNLIHTLPVPLLMKYLYPDFYALHDLPDEAGLPNEFGDIVLPERLNLTGESLQTHGLYLLDDGQVLFVWISKDVVPQLLLDAFGVDNVDSIPTGRCEMPVVEGSELNMRIRNLISVSRSRTDSVYFPSLFIIHEKSQVSLKQWAQSLLVEDRSAKDASYLQYMTTVRERIST